MLLRQCREIGIGMIIIDRHPHLTSSAVSGNTYTSICLNQKNPADINMAAGISQVDNEEKGCFSMLSVGQGIVKLQDRWRRPFLVRFPLVDVKKGLVSDDVLSRYLAVNRTKSTGSGRKTSVLTGFGQVRRVPLYDNALDNSAFAFIQDVLDHQMMALKPGTKDSA